MHVIIVGCGRVGSQLARILQEENHNVVVIDKEAKAFERLGKSFNGIPLIGNGYDLEVLKEAGIEKADAVAVVTNGDNTNIVTAEVAKKIFNVPKVIARVYDPQRAEIYRSLGLDIISGTNLVAAIIRDKLIESKFSTFLLETGKLGILEVRINEDLVGKTVEKLNIPGEFLTITVIRNDQVIIPEGKLLLQKDDLVMGVTRVESLKKIKKKLGLV